MNQTHELRQLLNELVNAWPSEHANPVVEEARSYLESDERTEARIGEGWEHQSTDEYKTELWYSI
jgi:hypothetical protein